VNISFHNPSIIYQKNMMSRKDLAKQEECVL
jgi:hypothetical protein